jgi:hypothetical protein
MGKRKETIGSRKAGHILVGERRQRSARTAPPRIEPISPIDLNTGGCTLMFIEA